MSEILPGQLRRIHHRFLTKNPDTVSVLLVLYPDKSCQGRTVVIRDGEIKSWLNDMIETITYPISDDR